MIGISATNFDVLERSFPDIIFSIKEGDGSGKPSTGFSARKTINFHNGYTMKITEILTKKALIDFYYYDLFDEQNRVIFKFHSEPHDKDTRYQTKTEPFHIHLPKELVLTSMDRMDNDLFTDLFSILHLVRMLFRFKEIEDLTR